MKRATGSPVPCVVAFAPARAGFDGTATWRHTASSRHGSTTMLRREGKFAGAVRPRAERTERARGARLHVSPRKDAPTAEFAASSPSQQRRPDYEMIGLYIGACLSQIVCMALALKGMDVALLYVVKHFGLRRNARDVIVYLFFAFLSIRSRIFSPLNSRRPTQTEVKEVRRPRWFPPTVVFPIVWSIIGFVLRPLSALLVVHAADGMLLSAPIVWFCWHLTLGDLWNHVVNVKKDEGTGASLVLAVLASAAWAALQFARVTPNAIAGKILLPLPSFLVFASALQWATWRLNGKPPLYPAEVASQS
ncbi:hypothetical protein FVE85_7794 [Porphyridium purpureum]|uniref:Uncharacterized protein n=1 Tax=Porphyridium purpureum TaxID=35688 RepID=A0A5J4YL61_PORPP|nr:hypothetical protein FVE85_7794 [Porphyridium purpureum]|eukprot:POR4538..scf210_14